MARSWIEGAFERFETANGDDLISVWLFINSEIGDCGLGYKNVSGLNFVCIVSAEFLHGNCVG